MVKYKEVEVAVGEELTVVRMILDINHNVVIGSFPGLCVTWGANQSESSEHMCHFLWDICVNRSLTMWTNSLMESHVRDCHVNMSSHALE